MRLAPKWSASASGETSQFTSVASTIATKTTDPLGEHVAAVSEK